MVDFFMFLLNSFKSLTHGASPMEAWAYVGLITTAIYMLFVLPLFWSLVGHWFGESSFFKAIVTNPGEGILLFILLMVTGPFILYLSIPITAFLLWVAFFRMMFSWMIGGSKKSTARP